MAGYDRERFASTSDSTLDELSCGICRDILCDPLMTPCCLQMFCHNCIDTWLESSDTCPYDRHPLSSAQLCRTPRIVMNMLLDLKIDCEFKDNGCDSVVTLDELPQHTANCRFNDTKYTDYEFEDYEEEEEPDLTANGLKIIENMMSEEMTEKVLSIVSNDIIEKTSLSVICAKISKKLDQKCGKRWHCSVVDRFDTQAIFIFEPGFWIQLKFGFLYYIIYKTQH
ncbi:unnamed protein product, partial [Medioppia subpectinata]